MSIAATTNDLARSYGQQSYQWACDLFPLCRSLTGTGVRKTLDYIRTILPDLQIRSVPSGTPAFDWTVPDEWNINDAFIADESGNKVVDFQRSNLHVVGYSEPIDRRMSFTDLAEHLHTLPDQPDAIPYITSYYSRRWGFCLPHRQYEAMRSRPDRQFRVFIDSSLQPGELNYADLVIPGESSEEVFFSTYICHPSLANNELSGPCLQTAIADWITRHLPSRRLTYRFFFGPETIGPIVYLSRNLAELRQKMIAGFVLSCVGDDRRYSYLASRHGDSLADRTVTHVLKNLVGDFRAYSYLDRESDERQYCAPGVDLPMCTISRSKYNAYPEYHTSLDDLSLISEAGFASSFKLVTEVIMALEGNEYPTCTVLCEPQLGRRGLYPSLSTKDTRAQVRTMMNLLAYSDGSKSLIDLADEIDEYVGDLVPLVKKLVDADVLSLTGASRPHGEGLGK